MGPVSRPIICLSGTNRQMGTGMSDMSTAPPVRVDGPVSIARLHGRACWDCGAVAKDLAPAGTVQVAGSDRVWAVASCGCRTGAVAS